MTAAGSGLLVAASLAAPSPGARVVTRGELVAAMRPPTYDITATTNAPRFQAEVLLRLARQAGREDPARRPLFLGHREWFEAYLERTGLTAERAPLFVRLSYRYAQDILVDYRRERVVTGGVPGPQAAVNVCVFWPATPGGPRSYSYEDHLATPKLKVTCERVIRYRLIDFGDHIASLDVSGLRGRPTTGLLALLFKVIGEGTVVESRMAISRDGLQISRARTRKGPFSVTTTVTVYPNGRMEKDVPVGRPDLIELEARLKRPMRVSHPPFECPPSSR